VIVRGPLPKANFTVISNDIVRDNSMSLRSRMLLIYMLSFPPDWRINYRLLAREMQCEGEHAIRKSLQELKQRGYVRNERRRGDGGKWETTTIVYDSPQPCGDYTRAEDPGAENHRPIEEPSTKYWSPDDLDGKTKTSGPEQAQGVNGGSTSSTADEPPEPKRPWSDWRAEDRELFHRVLSDTCTGDYPDHDPREQRQLYDAWAAKYDWPGRVAFGYWAKGQLDGYLGNHGLWPEGSTQPDDPWAA
jgi:hypothetical protein